VLRSMIRRWHGGQHGVMSRATAPLAPRVDSCNRSIAFSNIAWSSGASLQTAFVSDALRCIRVQFGRRQARRFDEQVDAFEQRAGNLAAIALGRFSELGVSQREAAR
jgi:hypothetical protein